MESGWTQNAMVKDVKCGQMGIFSLFLIVRTIYDGNWRNNLAYGYGKLIHACGDIYEGEWIDDKANGHGCYIHANRSKYEG